MEGPLSPVGLLVRTLLIAGLLAAIGAVGFRYIIINRLARIEPAVAGALAQRVARVGLFGAALIFVTALARLGMQIAAVRDPFTGTGPGMGVILSGTTWGKAWLVQVVLALIALAAFARKRWGLALIAALGLAFTPAFSGHAIGSSRWPLIAVLLDGLHTLAAAMWIGAMAMLAVGIAVPRQAGRPELALSMIAAFSPLALSAAATVALTGGLAGALHLGSLSALVSSRYGRTLLIKVGMVLAVVALGAFNWKRAGPQAMQQGDERSMARSIRAELAVSLLVLLATAALIVTPPPGEE